MKWMGSGTLGANAAWLLGGRGASIVCQTVYFVMLAHLLGSAQYGVYVGAFALVAVVSQYSTLGSQFVFMRYVSPDPRKHDLYWGNILGLTLGLGGALACVTSVLGHRLIPTCPQMLIVCVGFSECLFSQLTQAAACVFQAFEEMRRTVIVNVMVNSLRTLLAAVLLWRFHHLSAMHWAFGTTAISLCAAAAAVIAVTVTHGLPRFSLTSIRKHLLEGITFAFSSSTTNVYNDIDKVMLAHMGMTVANGIYTMAYKVIDMSMLPISSIHGAAFPRFFRIGVDGANATAKYARRLLSRTALMGIVLAAAIWIVAPMAPRILGHSFAGSVVALRWLCLLPFFRCFHLSAGDALAGAGYQKWRLAAQATAAGFNFIINLWMIPRYGWHGAAVASLVTDGGLGCLNWTVLAVVIRRAGMQVYAIAA
jgi:O-antigen/teichoic acid export membrane protein